MTGGDAEIMRDIELDTQTRYLVGLIEQLANNAVYRRWDCDGELWYRCLHCGQEASVRDDVTHERYCLVVEAKRTVAEAGE